jgi:hypothetical protein
MTEPRFRDERKTLKRPSGRSTLQLEELEREFAFRTWFPKDLVLTPRDMDEFAVDAAVEAFTRFCADNFMVKIAGKRVPLVLRDAQVETVRAILESKRTVILKARQIGFSTLLAAFCIWCAMGGSDRQIYMLSKGQNESRSLLSKARYGYRNLPQWVRERGPKLLDRTLERMTFENDSFLISSQSASDPIRGETAWMVIVDEWASIPDQEGAWASIEPTADQDEARIIGLSTAKGSGDFFHGLWVSATAGTNGFRPVFHSWRAVPDRDDEWYRIKKAENPVWFVSQEYPDNPEEAFIGSGNPFFDLDILRGWMPVEPLGRFRTYMDAGQQIITPDKYGDLQIWEHPSHKIAYVIGADVAAGLEHGDWSVFYVMEAKSRKVVAMYRGHVPPDVYAEQVLQPVGLYYNQALIAPEVNNMGSTVMSALMRCEYPNLYRRRSKLKRRETIMETMGWLTMSNNKPDLMNGVDRWMREGGHTLDEVSLAELKTFVREQKGDHVALHGSPHDDCVMALGITVMACRYAVENNLAEPKLDDRGSIRWWEQKLSSKTRGPKRLSPVM